ncbi:hypothetical protein SAMN05660748_0327 [Blastococcus aggregatus]|uniref:Uncharacterized protein n=1 Tax=Blastococcus aggregatus TaxID=38502 RepID=A0A285UXQ5_9ACTN|nr:hypothetical protein [Blastococcus aggregatus]SOC46589.1 hypothetical protein SAMN05660748_0327 [Blastococcus aggregatus]
MERHGRFIFMQTTADEDAHDRFVTESVARIPALRAQQEQRLARLREVLVQAGPADCLALASLTYLHKDPDTYRESEDDRSAAHIEFLAVQVLPLLDQPTPTPTPTEPASEGLLLVVGEALHLVRQLFEDTKELLVLRSVEAARRQGASSEFEMYRLQAMSQALSVRGTAFTEHTRFTLDGLFTPFDTDCRRILGFTANEAWSLLNAIPAVIEPRLRPRLNAATDRYRDAERDLNRLRRKRGLPPALAALTPTQQKAWLRETVFSEAYRQPVSLALLTAEALADAAGVSVQACAAWLDLFHCPPSEYVERFHHAPTGGHPLTRLPLLRLDTGYLAPVPSALAEALRPRMEDAIRDRDQALWNRYEAHRGRWVEETATQRLQAALPGSLRWVGIPWSGSADSSDVDGLVHCDDLTLRIQAKAGRISAPARRGAPSMVEDVTAVVSDAMHQHSRLSDALADETPAQLGFGAAQDAALSARLQIEVVVSLDDITVWSTETHKLRHLVAVPTVDQVPWVLSLADLMATTDLLSGTQLVHFLTRRQRLEREGRIEAHDELDWVGNYIFDGLFFDSFFEGSEPADVVRLNSYTEAIDSWYFSREGLTSHEIPKPTQPMPVELGALIARLEVDRPPHWLTAGVMLLNGNDESRQQVARSLTHTSARAREVGWSNASQALGPYGITLWVDHRYAGRTLSQLLTAYADQKIAELDRPNWLVIGLGADGRLTVVVRETDPDLTFVHVLLQRER